MRVLVTGARGFVGRHVVARLRARGDEVSEIDRAEGDVCDATVIASVVTAALPELVIHLAGQSSVARSFRDPVETFRVNALGTITVLEAVRLHAPAARIVVASSADVYAPMGGEDSLDESARLEPANPYAASKAAQETVARQYHRAFGLDVVVTRSFNAIGPGQSTEFAIPSFALQLAAIARDEAPPVLKVGNLTAVRDFTDVRDVAAAYEQIAMGAPSGTVFNICSGTGRSIRSVLDKLVEASGLAVDVEIDPDRLRPVDIERVVGNPARIRALAGWTPVHDLRSTLSDVYREASESR